MIKVDIQVPFKDTPTWKPPKSLGLKMLARLYEFKNNSDATFVVKDRRFDVHRWILQIQSPVLESLASSSHGTADEIPIPRADPDLFEMMFRFLYSQELPSNFDDERHALKLLELSERFGCSDLKMLLEARIVDSSKLLKVCSLIGV